MYRIYSKIIREAASVSGTSYPIIRVDGASAPTLTGKSYHWTTKTGRPVYHPNAYRRAFGNPIYHASTRRIEVGRDWLIANGLPGIA